jgi:hypothetical protein
MEAVGVLGVSHDLLVEGEAVVAYHVLVVEAVVVRHNLVVVEGVEVELRHSRRLSSSDGDLACYRGSRGSRAGFLCLAPILACRPRSYQSGMSALVLLC